MQPAIVIGAEAPPIGGVPMLIGMPLRAPRMIWSMCVRQYVSGSGVTICRKYGFSASA